MSASNRFVRSAPKLPNFDCIERKGEKPIGKIRKSYLCVVDIVHCFST
jgi:hypothetical protein